MEVAEAAEVVVVACVVACVVVVKPVVVAAPVVVVSADVDASVVVFDVSVWDAVVVSLAVFSVFVESVSFSCLASKSANATFRRPAGEAGAANVPSRNRDSMKVNIKDHRILIPISEAKCKCIVRPARLSHIPRCQSHGAREINTDKRNTRILIINKK